MLQLPKPIKDTIRRVVPRSAELPLRYYYRKFAGELEPEMRLLPFLIRPGSTAIDVGANVGVYTYALLRSCRVEAFEPFPHETVALRALRNNRLRVHNVALSDHDGSIQLHVPMFGDQPFLSNATSMPLTGRHQTVEVQCKKLDDFPLIDVSFMKIDVEGHEVKVLRGAEATIARWRPSLLIEIEQRHLLISMEEVFKYIESLGFRGLFLSSGQLHLLSSFRYEAHQKPFLDDCTDPRYVNNFVFLPKWQLRQRRPH